MNLSAFTCHDFAECLLGTLTFALILFCPGYIVGWVTNLLGFRNRPFGERIAWSVALSFGLTTFTAVMVAKYLSLLAACWLVVALSILAVGLLGRELLQQKSGFRLSRAGWLIAGAVLLWTAFVTLELIDIGIGNRLYMSIVMYDLSQRSAFVNSVVRTGVPPRNPFYLTMTNGAGYAAPMRYYYFWYVLAAMVAKLSRISAHCAMAASSVWSGIGLASLLSLYNRHFIVAGRRRAIITLALLTVTGLDIIAPFLAFLGGNHMIGDVEFWSQVPVDSWLDTLLWVPNHTAGLLCCLLGFLLVWLSAEESQLQRTLCSIVAGIAFASSLGLSVYVAAAFAMVMAAWLVWVWRWEIRSRRRAGVLLLAGAIAVVLLMPYLNELRSGGFKGVSSAKTHVFAFEVRPMLHPGMLKQLPGFRQLREGHPVVEDNIARLVLLIPGYIGELGFFALVFIAFFRRMLRGRLMDEVQRTAIFLTVTGIVIASFIRSTVIGTNDFGMRSMLIPQFFLLLMAAVLMDGEYKKLGNDPKLFLKLFLTMGLAATTYQAVMLRIYLTVENKFTAIDYKRLAERNMALRLAFSRMEGQVPQDAIVQYDTDQQHVFFNYSAIANLNRQTVNAFPDCDTAFGGDFARCDEIKSKLARLFGHLPAAPSSVDSAEARQLCTSLGINDLVATRWDNVWQAKSGWVWTLPAKVETPDVRVIDCAPYIR
jgi:hypothetical protein